MRISLLRMHTNHIADFPAESPETTFAMPAGNAAVKASYKDKTYTITAGDGQTYTLESNKALKAFKCDGDFGDFTGIQINGSDIDASNYEAESGSTLVTLKISCLETLKAGIYKIKFIYKDGTSNEARFTAKAAANSGTPKTGDNGNALFGWHLPRFPERGCLRAEFTARRKSILSNKQSH